MIMYTNRGKEIIVNGRDYDLLKEYQWVSYKTGKKGQGLVYTIIGGKKITLKDMLFPDSENKRIVHKNGNYFDFSRENVEILSDAESGHRYGGNRSSKTSEYHNVQFSKNEEKWLVVIGCKRECCYDHEEEAAIVSDYLALELYKDKANMNFPELNFDELELRYHKIKEKYGATKTQRWSKVMQGSSRCVNSTSKYVGVSLDKRKIKKKWTAKIKHMGKTIHLGSYEKEEEAAKAYDVEATKIYGKYAKLNFHV